MYDPRLGRWFKIDIYTAVVSGWTPYRAFADDPLNVIDSDGNLEWPLKGTHIFYSHVHKKISKKHWVGTKASLGHKGQYYSYAFDQTGLGIKTEAQKSAQKKGLLTTVNSEFFRLRSTGTSPHIGIDLKASIGTPIYALGEAKVVAKGTTKSGIKYLTIEFVNGDKHRYLHLSKYAENLKVGTCLKEGQIIAYTGNSGTYGKNKTPYPPHLHIDAVNSDGQMINPIGKNYGKMTNEEFFGNKEKVEAHQKWWKSINSPIFSVKTKGGVLNMRDSPSTKGKIILSLFNNSQFSATGRTNGNWIELKAGKNIGWVHKNYLKKN